MKWRGSKYGKQCLMCPVGAIEEASSNIPTAAGFFLIFAAVLFFSDYRKKPTFAV